MYRGLVSSKTFAELLERDSDKIKQMSRERGVDVVDPEWSILSELGGYYGYGVIEAIRSNSIKAEDMYSLLKAGRQMAAIERSERTVDIFMAFIGTQSQKGSAAFKKHLKEIGKI